MLLSALPLPSGEAPQVLATHPKPQRPDLGRHLLVTPGGLGLTTQRAEPSLDLSDQVGEPHQIGLGPLQPSQRALLAELVLEDPGCFLDDRPVLLGSGVEDRVHLTLPDDDVLGSSDRSVGKEFLDVEEPAVDAVYLVVARPVAIEAAGDGDFFEVERQLA